MGLLGSVSDRSSLKIPWHSRRNSQYPRKLILQDNESEHLHAKYNGGCCNGSEESDKTDSLRALALAYSRRRRRRRGRGRCSRHDGDVASVVRLSRHGIVSRPSDLSGYMLKERLCCCGVGVKGARCSE